MDRMHDELLKLNGNGSNSKEGMVVSSVDDDAWETVGRKNKSAIVRTQSFVPSELSAIFGGQLQSVVKAAGTCLILWSNVFKEFPSTGTICWFVHQLYFFLIYNVPVMIHENNFWKNFLIYFQRFVEPALARINVHWIASPCSMNYCACSLFYSVASPVSGALACTVTVNDALREKNIVMSSMSHLN